MYIPKQPRPYLQQPYPVRLFLAGVFTINRAAQRTLPPRPAHVQPVRYCLFGTRFMRRMLAEVNDPAWARYAARPEENP